MENRNYFIPLKADRERIAFLQEFDPMKLSWDFATAR